MNPPPPFLQASFPFSLLFYFSFPSLLFHPLRFPMFPPYLPLFFPVLSSFFILSFHFIFSLIIHHPYCLPYFLFFNCFFSPSVLSIPTIFLIFSLPFVFSMYFLPYHLVSLRASPPSFHIAPTLFSLLYQHFHFFIVTLCYSSSFPFPWSFFII